MSESSAAVWEFCGARALVCSICKAALVLYESILWSHTSRGEAKLPEDHVSKGCSGTAFLVSCSSSPRNRERTPG